MKKLLVIIVALIFMTGCGVKELFSNPKVNNNENVVMDKTFDNLVINNVSLVYEKGISTFKFTITNNGAKTNVSKLNVIFKNENDSVITVLDGAFGEIDNTSLDIVLTSDIDLSDAYKVEYEL